MKRAFLIIKATILWLICILPPSGMFVFIFYILSYNDNYIIHNEMTDNLYFQCQFMTVICGGGSIFSLAHFIGLYDVESDDEIESNT